MDKRNGRWERKGRKEKGRRDGEKEEKVKERGVI